MDKVQFEAGTLIHVGGFPFRLLHVIEVGGSKTNQALALESLRESQLAVSTGAVQANRKET